MALRRETVFWLGVLGGLAFLLWLLSPILLPFVLGMALGYLLDPVVEWLARLGLSRTAASGLLIVGAFLGGVVALITVLPAIIGQTVDFARHVPELLGALRDRLQPLVARVLADVQATPAGDLTGPLSQVIDKATDRLPGIAGDLVGRGLALVNVLSLLAITPLVAFYLLRDWPKIVAEIDDWLPRASAPTIRAQIRAIDTVLAGFARGSATVCGLLALFYGIALSAVGLDFGLVIGLTAGAVSFVPYLGFIVGLTSSVGVALYQFWPDWMRVAIVLAIFFAGQIVSDYVLVPRLVGERIGLHPLWVIFGVFAGGALFGFVGVLLSVPVCAVIGVLTRFAIGRYKDSDLYRGVEAG
ncbi:MAG TPA: AI-2E family transporter [Candidatus Eisenbacteria bacterium]|nr:AI-2E family transporter [Candidatus Eisenbacteria bacterium]